VSLEDAEVCCDMCGNMVRTEPCYADAKHLCHCELYTVLLRRRVTNAAKRNGDRVYALRVGVPDRPVVGDYITVDVFGRSVEVERIEHRAGKALLWVWLKSDHRTFKNPSSFDANCADYEKRGWHWTTEK
jgi:hypothetical protein